MALMDAGTLQRACLRGHDTMLLLPGLFSLPEMVQPPQGLLARAMTGPLVASGKVFAVRIYACQTCGSIELVDADKVY